MSASKTLFADILLPLPLPGLFTYHVPMEMEDEVAVGVRVIVQFGSKKVYSGLVKHLHHKTPSYAAKSILGVLDASPVVMPVQYRFWEWMARYYLCHEGEVMNAALPQALKLQSETRIILNPAYEGSGEFLSDREYLLYDALEAHKSLSLTDASKITEVRKVFPIIKGLIEKGVVALEEDIQDMYVEKREFFVRLQSELEDEDRLREAFDSISPRAFKQTEMLMGYIKLSGRYEISQREVSRKDLLALFDKAAHSTLSALEKKGIFEVYEKVVSRLAPFTGKTLPLNELNEGQQTALQEIQKSFEEKNVVLLHGVTSSGKTEVYCHLIDECLKRGEHVLYLVPEIALTTQLVGRLQKHFGKRVGVYHSRFNPQERVEIWNRLLLSQSEESFEPLVITGARSALFLPFQKLGLIIVDEEHDPSFKQMEPAPRYNGRDAAIYLGTQLNSRVLLGSATPSIETYHSAQSGRFGLVELKKRHGGVQLPEVLVVDLKKEARERQMKSHYSVFLLEHIREALDRKEQVILFQNRRGFSLRLECEVCDWVPECQYCDVSLIYHKNNNHLKCHYCGYTIPPPKKCPHCQSTSIKMKGFGTEKIEEELPVFFPGAIVARMDMDTTRKKSSYQNLIHDFEDRKIDILVGTQMVTKGLDFENVSLVGILNADNMLGFPDFRAHEKGFQLMAQVSGRAGRKDKRGKVVIQTSNPYHAVIRGVIENDYQGLFKNEILERRNFHYPPFYRLVLLTVKHTDAGKLNQAADVLAAELRKSFGNFVLGPEYPMVSRVRNEFIKNIMVKIRRDAQLTSNKEQMNKILEKFKRMPDFKMVKLLVNVDPQ